MKVFAGDVSPSLFRFSRFTIRTRNKSIVIEKAPSWLKVEPRRCFLLMMVMMVVTRVRVFRIQMTFPLLTFLVFGLDLERGVEDSVLGKLLAYVTLDVRRRGIRDDVHRRIKVLSVGRPNVDMMNVENSVDLFEMASKLIKVDVLGRFFKKQICDFKKGLQCIG